jgi:hypothetical protein
MSFTPDARTAFVLRRELKLLRLQPRETLLWAGPAKQGRRDGMLACTSLRVTWIRGRLWKPARRSWDLSLVQSVAVHVDDVQRARIVMQAKTAVRPYLFAAERRDAKAFAAAVESTTPAARQKAQQATDERLARLDRMVRKGTMTEGEAKANAERLLRERRDGDR